MEIHYCPTCGDKIRDDAAFCTQCGSRRGTWDPGRAEGLPGAPPTTQPAEPQASPSPNAQPGIDAYQNSPTRTNKRTSFGRLLVCAIVAVFGIPIAFFAYYFLDASVRGEKIDACCFQNDANGAWSVHQIAVRRRFPGFSRGFNDPRGPEAQLGPAGEAKIEQTGEATYKISSYFIQLPNTMGKLHEIGYEKTDYTCIVKYARPNEWRVVSLTAGAPMTLPYSSLVDGSNSPVPAAQQPSFRQQWADTNAQGLAAFEAGDYDKAKELFWTNIRELQGRLNDPFREKEDPLLAKSRNNLAEILLVEGEYRNAKQLWEDALQTFRIRHEDEIAASIANKLAILESGVTYSRPNHGMYLSDMFGTFYWALDTWASESPGSPLDEVKARLKKLSSRHFYCDRYIGEPRQYPEDKEACTLLPETYDQAIEAVSARFGSDHQAVATLLIHYARTCQENGDKGKSDELSGRAAKIMAPFKMMK